MSDVTKSLRSTGNILASAAEQIKVLQAGYGSLQANFSQKLQENQLFPLRATGIEILQVNLGKMCNQVCRHCHVDAGPDRKEIMSRKTMLQCLDVLRNTDIKTVDITGGAPEMNPDFRWFVEECSRLDKKVIVRCNLTIIEANKKYHDLPEFYKLHKVEVVSSLPFYNQDKTDRQRGKGVFVESINALRKLNEVGYGMKNTDLVLNLVYNPAGAFLPAAQNLLETQFKKVLAQEFDIHFNQLFTITNMPVSRYLDYLLQSGNYDTYMEKLKNAFNPQAAGNVMCRNTISVGWDGFLYDCDFNQMLELKVNSTAQHISEFSLSQLNNREVIVNEHCFGCTAGSGSSCGGATA